MRYLIISLVAAAALMAAGCDQNDGCDVGSSKCENNNVMMCNVASLDDLSDGTWEVQETCTANEKCEYNEEYGMHYCKSE